MLPAKALSLPVMTMAPTCASASKASSARRSSAISPSQRAFSACGRCSRIRPTLPLLPAFCTCRNWKGGPARGPAAGHAAASGTPRSPPLPPPPFQGALRRARRPLPRGALPPPGAPLTGAAAAPRCQQDGDGDAQAAAGGCGAQERAHGGGHGCGARGRGHAPRPRGAPIGRRGPAPRRAARGRAPAPRGPAPSRGTDRRGTGGGPCPGERAAEAREGRSGERASAGAIWARARGRRGAAHGLLSVLSANPRAGAPEGPGSTRGCATCV